MDSFALPTRKQTQETVDDQISSRNLFDIERWWTNYSPVVLNTAFPKTPRIVSSRKYVMSLFGITGDLYQCLITIQCQ